LTIVVSLAMGRPLWQDDGLPASVMSSIVIVY